MPSYKSLCFVTLICLIIAYVGNISDLDLNILVLVAAAICVVSIIILGVLLVINIPQNGAIPNSLVNQSVKKVDRKRTIVLTVMGVLLLPVSLLCCQFVWSATACKSQSNEWVVSREVTSGIIVERRGASWLCKEEIYVYCLEGKCPHLYTMLTFKRQQSKTNKNNIESLRQPILTDGFWYFLFWGNLLKLQGYQHLTQYYEPELSGLLVSMLFGGDYISRDLKEKMKQLGLLHIVAISGVNITIFVELVQVFLVRFSKKVVFISETFIIIGFLGITGFSPPTIRACFSAILRRVNNSLGYSIKEQDLLCYAIGFCVLLFPEFLNSVSFYLTCAALIGLIIIFPYFEKWFSSFVGRLRKESARNYLVQFCRKLLLKESISNGIKAIAATSIIEICINVVLYFAMNQLNFNGIWTWFIVDHFVEGISILGYLLFPFIILSEVLTKLFGPIILMYLYTLRILIQILY